MTRTHSASSSIYSRDSTPSARHPSAVRWTLCSETVFTRAPVRIKIAWRSFRRHACLPRKYSELLDLLAQEGAEVVGRIAADEFDTLIEQTLAHFGGGCRLRHALAQA